MNNRLSTLLPGGDRALLCRRLGGILLAFAAALAVRIGFERQARSALLAARSTSQPPGRDYLAEGRAAARQQLWWEGVEELSAAIAQGADTAEAHHLLGVCLGNLGWMEDAITEYKAALRRDPPRTETCVSLSTTYRSIGRRAEALRVLRRGEEALKATAARDAAKRYARPVAPRLETLAQACAYLGDFEKALSLAAEAQTADPTRAEAYLLAGKCDLALHRADKALPVLRRACALDGKNADAYYTLALALREHPSPAYDDSALSALTTAIRLRPEHAPAHFQLGILYAQRKRWQEAHRAFMAAYQLQFEPTETLRRAGEAYRQAGDDARSHYLLGQYAEKSGDLWTALGHFRKLSAIPAYRISGYAHAAAVLRALGRPQEAIVTLKRAIALEPNSAELDRQLASAYSVTQRVNEQVAALQKAIALDPGHADGDYLMLGLLAVDSGKYDEAEGYLEKCVQMQPNNGDYQYALGKTYLVRPEKSDRLRRAIQHLETARGPTPGNVYVHEYLSVAYTKAQRWNDAVIPLRRAIELNPRIERHYFRLGQVYQRLGKREEARRVLAYYDRLRKFEVQKDLLRRRMHAHPDDPAAHGALGALLLKACDYAAARREFQNAIVLKPEDAAAHEKLATIYGELSQPEEQARELRIVARLRSEE